MNTARKTELMQQYPKGTRVRLVFMNDMCSIQISWDTGSTVSQKCKIRNQITRLTFPS